MKRFARLLWRLIGPVVFIVLIARTDRTEIGAIWRAGHPFPIALAALLSVPVILLKAWRWRRLMRYQGIHYAYAPAARYYAIASALAAWTPGRLGDFSKAVAVQRDCRVGLGRALSSVIADRLMDGVLLGGVAACGAAFLPGPWAPWIAGAGGAGVVLAAWTLFRRRGKLKEHALSRGAQRIASVAGRTLRGLGGTGKEVGDAIDGLKVLARPRGITIGTTLAAGGCAWVQGWLMARSLGMPVGFWTLTVALSAVSIASLVPVSVAGFGTREAMLAMFLVPGGVTLPQVIGFSLAYFVIVSGTLALIGAAAWTFHPEVRVSITP